MQLLGRNRGKAWLQLHRSGKVFPLFFMFLEIKNEPTASLDALIDRYTKKGRRYQTVERDGACETADGRRQGSV